MEKALQFYCDYVASQDCFSVLPPMLVAAIRATVQNSESHICRLLFKLAVEMDMMMNVLAAAWRSRRNSCGSCAAGASRR